MWREIERRGGGEEKSGRIKEKEEGGEKGEEKKGEEDGENHG